MNNESVTELEAELAACREQLKEAQQAPPSDIEGHGFCSAVLRMRREGRTDADIAAYLKGKGLSRRDVGVLVARDEVVLNQ